MKRLQQIARRGTQARRRLRRIQCRVDPLAAGVIQVKEHRHR